MSRVRVGRQAQTPIEILQTRLARICSYSELGRRRAAVFANRKIRAADDGLHIDAVMSRVDLSGEAESGPVDQIQQVLNSLGGSCIKRDGLPCVCKYKAGSRAEHRAAPAGSYLSKNSHVDRVRARLGGPTRVVIINSRGETALG